MLLDVIGVKVLLALSMPTCLMSPGGTAPQCLSNTIYSGDAYGAGVKVLGLKVTLSDTGALPAAGGSLSKQLLSADVPGILNVGVLTESTNGGANHTTSQSSVANVNLHVAGITVTAEVLTANASAQACGGVPTAVAGSSVILGLKVNGLDVTVTGAPNQTIPLIVGALIINEQISAVASNAYCGNASMKVNALHLTVAGLADVVISSAQAGVNCLPPPTPPGN